MPTGGVTEQPIYITFGLNEISYVYENDMGETISDRADLTQYHNLNNVLIFGTIFSKLEPNLIPYRVTMLNNYQPGTCYADIIELD